MREEKNNRAEQSCKDYSCKDHSGENHSCKDQSIEALQAELKREHERFRVIFENTTVSIWDYNFATRQIIQPSRSRELHGFETVIENVPDSLIESGFIHPDSAQAFREMYDRLFAGEMHVEGIFRVQTADRTGYWYEYIRYNTLPDADGVPYAAVGMSTDVTEEMENKKALERWKELLSGTLGRNGAVIEYDLYNDSFIGMENTEMTNPEIPAGTRLDEFVSEYVKKHVYASDMEMVRKGLQRAVLLADYLDGKREFTMEYRIQHGEKLYWIRLSVKMLRYQSDDTVHLFMLHSDITGQKEKELELQRKADQDALTGLLNYRAFAEQAQAVFAQFSSHSHILLMVDLDTFREVNDTYGHIAGDRMLRHTGGCISSLLAEWGENALSGRVGGDEFAILFYNCGRGRAEQFAKTLMARLAEPALDGICLSASIGIAVSPEDGDGFDELFLAADRAACYVKRHGKNACCFYDSIWHEKKETLLRRQQFLSDNISGGMVGFYMEEGFPLYFIDDRMLQWLGYEREEEFVQATGGLLENGVHPDDLDYVTRTVRQQLQHEDRFEADHRIRKRDGSYIWVHETGEKMTAPDGRPAVTSVCRDITVEKEHANLLSHLVYDANGGIGLYRVEEDWRLRLLYASENLGELANYSDEEYKQLCSQDAMESIYEADRGIVLENIRKAIAEDSVSSVSYRVPDRNGGYVWITGTFSRFGEDQGRPVLRAVYMPLPIQYELQLQTLDADSIGVHVFDGDTEELYYANEAAFRMFGVPVTDITGKRCFEIFYKGVCDSGDQDWWRQRGDREHRESYLGVDGKTIGIQMQERRWKEKNIVIVYSRDVSEQISAQRQRDELLNRVPGGVCLFRFDGRNLEPVLVSDALTALSGMDKKELMEEMKGLDWSFVHPDDLPGLKQFLKTRVVRPGENYSYQFRLWNARKQTYSWIEFHINTVRQKGEMLFYVTCSDITNANRVQERLENSQHALNVVVQYGNLGMWSYDLDTRQVEQEYSSYKVYGYDTLAENVPDSLIEQKLVHPEDAAAYRECCRRILDGEESSDCIVRMRNQLTGKYLWMHVFLVRRKDLQDGHRRAIGFSIVVDQEVNSIRRLEQTRAELQTVVKEMVEVQDRLKENQKVMEARLKLERKKLQGNDRNLLFYYIANISRGTVSEYKDIFMETPLLPEQLSMEKFTKNGREKLAFPADSEWLAGLHRRERLLANYQDGIVQEEYKTQILLENGTIVWTSHTMQLLQDPASGDILLYEYVYDINTDQIFEAMLKMEMSYGYEVIGNLFVRDDQFTFLEMEEQTGASRLNCVKFADYIREYSAAWLYPEDKKQYIDHYTRLQEIAADPGCVHSEVLYRTFGTDGSIRYHKDDNYFYDKEKGIFLLTRREYTDFVRSEEAEKKRLEDALAKAEEAGKAKNEFLARMSHDMRTPMNAIIGLTALTVDAAEDPAEVRANMAKMNSASDFLLGLVNDILDMAKIEDRSLSLNLEPYRYRDFLMNARTVFLPQCEAKGIQITFQDMGVNPTILCDKTRVNQIFYNILSNAVKYTLPGGTVSYEVHNLRIENGRLSADFVVKDSGIGMDEEFQKRMFEPFTRENTAITAELQGSGLGLSITRQLVELMGGKIRISSRKGQGTTVVVSLNFECLSGNTREEAPRPAVKSSPSVLEGRVVLLAEDHPLNAEIASKLLEMQKMTVLHAENGRIAVEMFKASEPGSIDVILMDIRMPEMDGLQAAAAVRALGRTDAGTVPIIAMSANAYPEDVRKSLDAGMNAHLSKPIDIAALLRTLEEFLK